VRSVNEDRAFEGVTLFAVADGMGGHAGGEIAASAAIEALQAGFARAPSEDGLVQAVHDANRAVWERGIVEQDLRGMGTTLTAAGLVSTDDGDRLILVNVGDSRSYRLRTGALVQLTTDHSVAEELVARGELSEEEAAVHPHRHILTRALGVSPDVDVDVWEVVPEEGDRFLLCSDGLTNEVFPDRIATVLTSTRDPQKAAETLVRMANESGGNDNVTVVVLDVLVGDQSPGLAPRAAAGRGAPVGDVDTGGGSQRPSASGAAPPAVSRPASLPEASGAEATGTGARTASVASAVVERRPPADGNGTAGAVVGRSVEPTDERRGIVHATRHAPQPRIHVPRRVTFRVLFFVVLLGGLGWAAYTGIHWYVDGSYFVGLEHDQIVIYQGRPGGFVGIKPHVVQRTPITAAQVPSYKLPDLQAGVLEPSLAGARQYVANLLASACSLQQPPADLHCPTTTTTVPPASTSTTVHSALDAGRRVVRAEAA